MGNRRGDIIVYELGGDYLKVGILSLKAGLFNGTLGVLIEYSNREITAVSLSITSTESNSQKGV